MGETQIVAKITQDAAIKFIYHSIVYRLGVPQHIIILSVKMVPNSLDTNSYSCVRTWAYTCTSYLSTDVGDCISEMDDFES